MSTLTTFVRAGRIRFDEPSDLPEGSPVEVTLRPAKVEPDEDGPMPPDEIARVLSAMRALPKWEVPV